MASNLSEEEFHRMQVRHLEETNGAMAEDIMQKSAIISHYVMDGRIDQQAIGTNRDKLSIRKVLDIVNKNDDIRDMNKKLQRMLEETLTKNMHLQQDLDHLSAEIVQLSKEQVLQSHDTVAFSNPRCLETHEPLSTSNAPSDPQSSTNVSDGGLIIDNKQGSTQSDMQTHSPHSPTYMRPSVMLEFIHSANSLSNVQSSSGIALPPRDRTSLECTTTENHTTAVYAAHGSEYSTKIDQSTNFVENSDWCFDGSESSNK